MVGPEAGFFYPSPEVARALGTRKTRKIFQKSVILRTFEKKSKIAPIVLQAIQDAESMYGKCYLKFLSLSESSCVPAVNDVLSRNTVEFGALRRRVELNG